MREHLGRRWGGGGGERYQNTPCKIPQFETVICPKRLFGVGLQLKF